MPVDPAVIEVLQRRFGHAGFRPGQQEIVASVLSGRPTLAVMPTGAGKSLCYQLPAALLEGLTVVVSPLVSLMRDQVEGLRRRGIDAACLHSAQGDPERLAAERAIATGQVRLAYVAPERFRNALFRQLVGASPVALVAVDEAHCVSEWGHAFRPDYALLGDALAELRPARLVALTATASPDVRADILRSLRVRDANVIVAGHDRPNIHLEVHEVDTEAEKLDTCAAALREHGPAIVYCATRRQATGLAQKLAAQGLRARPYHAGLSAEERARTQDAFLEGELGIVTATNAFGLGIDKPDVRLVAHTEVPRSLEAYYQELGRAGRDGEPAIAAMLFARKDIFLQRRLLALATPKPEIVARLWQALVRSRRGMSRDELDRLRPERSAKADVFASLAFLESTGLVGRTTAAPGLRVRLARGVGAADESAGGALARCLAVHGETISLHTAAAALGCATVEEAGRAIEALAREGVVAEAVSRRPGWAYVAAEGRALGQEHLHQLRLRSAREQARFAQMLRLADGGQCRRHTLLRALGEPAAPTSCQGCDVCTGRKLRTIRSRLRAPVRAAVDRPGPSLLA